MRQLQLPLNLLSDKQRNMLQHILSKHRVDVLNVPVKTIGLVPLEDDQRRQLQDILMDEFLDIGLGSDYEPNEIGLQLEDLIDVLNNL